MLSCVVAGIETNVYGLEENPGAAAVFVTHGRGGKMADNRQLCQGIQAQGLIAVGVEQRNHGKRMVDRGANLYQGSHASDMYGIMLGTALDITLLIDLLPARLGIDTQRCGVTGISLGGHVSLLAMAQDRRITAGVAFIGSGDFAALMEQRHKLPEFREMDFADFYPPALADIVQRYDPIERPEAFADQSLLLLNGEDDDLVPIECNRRFEAVLRPRYVQGERLRLSPYPGLGHEVSPAMEAEGLQWLKRWLS